ncbi:MAG: hypothetical protein V9G19_03870 [Tetrasphaera sp.]
MATRMSKAALDRARAFVEEHARPLERVRLAHVLGEAEPGDVATALGDFATPDGGIGKALESDCRAPEASVLGALTALDILRMHGVPGGDPLVAQVCAWLVGHVESDAEGRLVWPFLPPSAQASPHAPWWDQAEPGQLAATFAGYLANPGLAIAAHLWRHEGAAPGSIPRHLLNAVTWQAVDVATAGVSAEEVNAHDALAHVAGERAVPAQARDRVTAYLGRVLPDRVMSTPADFAGYGIHPLWIAPTPEHPLAAVIGRQVAQAIDHTITSQQPDGSWTPFWDWGGWHPDIWAQARWEWSGALVVRNVAALRAHGAVSSR